VSDLHDPGRFTERRYPVFKGPDIRFGHVSFLKKRYSGIILVRGYRDIRAETSDIFITSRKE